MSLLELLCFNRAESLSFPQRPTEEINLAGERGRHVKKPWGSELIWTETERYVGKVISINPGQRLSLQYHELKDEAIFVTEGTLRLHLEDQSGEIKLIDLAPG